MIWFEVFIFLNISWYVFIHNSKWINIIWIIKYVKICESIYLFGPPISQDYPLNLSILLSGGKETNKDSLSNGEWSGNSSDWKSSEL